MNKKLLKTLTGLAIVGTALGAAFAYIKKCKELSLYETNKRPLNKCKLLTLSTCEYSNKNGRLVVIAYEINS